MLVNYTFLQSCDDAPAIHWSRGATGHYESAAAVLRIAEERGLYGLQAEFIRETNAALLAMVRA